MHGTFAGTDAIGLFTELSRYAPEFSKALSEFGKGSVNFVVGETGNYTPDYVTTMQTCLSQGQEKTIPVRLINWSGQNNHIARADGAVRLVFELAQVAEQLPSGSWDGKQPRIMLWGHSHGGNVFALLTNLLAADKAERDEFFHAARTFYRPWFWGDTDLPKWQKVRDILEQEDHPVRKLALDVVTYGTPIRYAWDMVSCSKLLHVIHHRSVEGQPEYLAPPVRPDIALSGKQGDFMQQIAIAGTNIAPLPVALRTFLSDWRLDNFLERDLTVANLLTRLKHRMRVPEFGTTLLVEYDEVKWGVHQHLAGHAMYTRSKWLPFHCEQIAKHFYSE